MASDSRTNAGYDQVNICKKMHTFVQPGERVFITAASGSLSCSQSILTLLRKDSDAGNGLATADSMYDAARIVGQQLRKVADMDRAALERDDYRFNVHFIIGGQIRGQPPELYLIYPQGNPLQARRMRRSSKSARSSTAGRSSIAGFNTLARRSKRRPSMLCSRWIQR